ncbi:hypothetical protein [Roseivivax sediminis]|uniref:Uncharacterized protein n=1 Tax=Roseivivax sediminis TaxID=936889 RepID=A0A1I2EKE0_9RHOB|nr:hypothetical protein [Roseivivax sediminis]SFE93335.1 hypothetical protein SAMN04515678_12516 [Roseivivax sediminis]
MNQMNLNLERASMRKSLARGYARQVLDAAHRDGCCEQALESALGKMPRKGRGLARWCQQVRRRSGVLAVAQRSDRTLVIDYRKSACGQRMDAEGRLFKEETLNYTRYLVTAWRAGYEFIPVRASFSAHAIQRFVERGTVSLGDDFGAQLDMEGRRVLQGFEHGQHFVDGADYFATVRDDGVWAGAFEDAQEERWWPTAKGCVSFRWMAFRTFLGPDEMRPVIWHRWNEARRHQAE